MNNPGDKKESADQEWEGLNDEEILQRLEEMSLDSETNPSGDSSEKARAGLEILRRAAEGQPNQVTDSNPLEDVLGSELANNPGLQRRVRSWLSPKSGTVLGGRYRLIERIGEGGMGPVWVGEQLEPVRRRVAIKLVKPGMDSRQVLDRF